MISSLLVLIIHNRSEQGVAVEVAVLICHPMLKFINRNRELQNSNFSNYNIEINICVVIHNIGRLLLHKPA